MEASPATDTYRTELRATGGLLAWGAAWVASLALARFGPGIWGESLPVVTWVAVAVNVVVGVGWIVAFARFLRAIDDLNRKILQDALAAALGAGWVLGSAYVAAEAAGVIPIALDFAALPITMGTVFLGAFLGGKIRYR